MSRMSFVWSYFMVAKRCLRFLMVAVLSCGSLNCLASRLRFFLQRSPMYFEHGKGVCSGCLVRYCLSISAVLSLSLNDRELCPLHPVALTIPLSASMLFLCIVSSSLASSPVSARIVKIVA